MFLSFRCDFFSLFQNGLLEARKMHQTQFCIDMFVSNFYEISTNQFCSPICHWISFPLSFLSLFPFLFLFFSSLFPFPFLFLFFPFPFPFPCLFLLFPIPFLSFSFLLSAFPFPSFPFTFLSYYRLSFLLSL